MLTKCLLIAAFGMISAALMVDANSEPKRDINVVLRDHEKQLLAIPNVIGVYVGVIEGTRRPCLKVMLAQQPRKTDPPIPRRIEGYSVVTEVTGPIRPLNGQ